MTPASTEIFGRTAQGETVERIRLRGGGLCAAILTYGAVIQDLRLDGHQPPLVLGFEALEDYLQHSPYFGATPGRYANRIAGGRFSIEGETYQLECNEGGVTHLHGGSDGLACCNWTIDEAGEDFVVLSIRDPHGRAGYPGNLDVTATYRLLPGAGLSVVYRSQADRATPANMCQHSYFNLDGRADVLDHDLMLAADSYLPVDDRLIPTGEQRAVTGTPFDFRAFQPIRRSVDGRQVPYDHNFCLSPVRVAKRTVGMVRSTHSGIAMELRTTEPGVQFYAGVKLDVPVPGLEGRRYGPFAGFCLETQVWPDGPNQATFPRAVIAPGEVLLQETDYIFMRD
jgi:aldose 1-epimerase